MGVYHKKTNRKKSNKENHFMVYDLSDENYSSNDVNIDDQQPNKSYRKYNISDLMKKPKPKSKKLNQS